MVSDMRKDTLGQHVKLWLGTNIAIYTDKKDAVREGNQTEAKRATNKASRRTHELSTCSYFAQVFSSVHSQQGCVSW